MSDSDLLWGLVLIVTGVFVSSYGTVLFRWALAAMGFGIVTVIVYSLLDETDPTQRAIISLGAGIIAAIALIFATSIGVYLAGAIFGIVLSIVVLSAFDIFWDQPSEWVIFLLAIVGAGAGGFFGPRLGDYLLIIATSSAGALLVVAGILRLFDETFNRDLENPLDVLNSKVTMVTFLCMVALSGIGQFNTWRIRRNLLH